MTRPRHAISVLCFLTAFLTLVSQACTKAPSDEPPANTTAARARFSARLDSLRIAKRIPGLAVAVLEDTAILLAKGYGFADVEKQIPVTPETPFHIASVTKPLAAVLALQLEEKGVLNLDRRMHTYTDFKEFCADARDAGGIFFDDWLCGDSTLTLRHVLSMTANGRSKPGERFFYNPLSYSWASRPIMEVTGRPFSALMDSLIFRPAGMKRSARRHRDLPLPPEIETALARPYHLDSTGAVMPSTPPPLQGDGAGGGVISTALDLAAFDRALMQDRLISPASREAMWTPPRTAAGAPLPYGLGWFLQTYRGERLVWHTGLWGSRYSALYLKAPDRGLTLILLANSDGVMWDAQLDEVDIGKSEFARMFLEELTD
jgi:CubicO group peptidase (beta-lactamase class C family)